MKILMVLTSHKQLGDTGLKTGLWLEEFATAYYVFQDNNIEVVLASPLGGQPPITPQSCKVGTNLIASKRFASDPVAQDKFANTILLQTIDVDDYDGVFYPGGHGLLWDLVHNLDSISIINKMYKKQKVLGFTCHAPSVLYHTQNADGEPLVLGKKVTGFSNSEEDSLRLTGVVPFLLEDMLIANGALYEKGENGEEHIAVDLPLITGQNSASSAAVAEKMINLLK